MTIRPRRMPASTSVLGWVMAICASTEKSAAHAHRPTPSCRATVSSHLGAYACFPKRLGSAATRDMAGTTVRACASEIRAVARTSPSDSLDIRAIATERITGLARSTSGPPTNRAVAGCGIDEHCNDEVARIAEAPIVRPEVEVRLMAGSKRGNESVRLVHEISSAADPSGRHEPPPRSLACAFGRHFDGVPDLLGHARDCLDPGHRQD
jgi:hypothetical protein